MIYIKPAGWIVIALIGYAAVWGLLAALPTPPAPIIQNVTNVTYVDRPVPYEVVKTVTLPAQIIEKNFTRLIHVCDLNRTIQDFIKNEWYNVCYGENLTRAEFNLSITGGNAAQDKLYVRVNNRMYALGVNESIMANGREIVIRSVMISSITNMVCGYVEVD